MAIEPLGSVMTMQAQTMNAPKPAAQVEKPEVSADSVVPQAERVDKTTNVVENAQAKNQNGNSAEQQEQPNTDKIKQAVEKLNKNLKNSEAIFGIHEATNRVTIKIVDKDTKEVIKELPPEKTLDMIAKAWELAGILVDERR
ncbi:MAG: flagellar protein FlaG [Clostridium sp.]|nr:flagellar protein FlaG [Acetatifactor muris]MCM1526396.1 flagellar protein FlaG [Bacteroides sp.]MCM1563241.1 flagellar protein FlaG [Clostridium sp.]